MPQYKKIDPITRVSKRTYERALRSINRIRKSFNGKPLKRLPSGYPKCEGGLCPIEQALSFIGDNPSVLGDELTLVKDNEMIYIHLPMSIFKFVGEFDSPRP